MQPPSDAALRRASARFVFLDWEYAASSASQPWKHATLLYFDIPKREQVFVDPSLQLLMNGKLQYFLHHHLWVPDSENPRLIVTRHCI